MLAKLVALSAIFLSLQVKGQDSEELSNLLRFGAWRTNEELEVMTEDDKRNCAVVEINLQSSLSIEDLGALPNTGDLGSLVGFGSISLYLLKFNIRSKEELVGMDYGDQRNTLIVHLSKVTGLAVLDLQSRSDMSLFERAVSIACSKGWVYFPRTHLCYHFNSNKITWDAAEEKCVAQGGHLASVPDQDTNTFLTTFPKALSWIGAIKKDGQWTWSDGSAWSYSNWHPKVDQSFPDSNVIYAAINWYHLGDVMYGFWNDRGVDNRQYICQKPVDVHATPTCGYKYYPASVGVMCTNTAGEDGICDGTVEDCVAKGKEWCNNNPKYECFGFQILPGWTAIRKTPQFCRILSTSGSKIEDKPRRDWDVYKKCDCN